MYFLFRHAASQTQGCRASTERDCLSFQIFVAAVLLISSMPTRRVWTKPIQLWND